MSSTICRRISQSRRRVPGRASQGSLPFHTRFVLTIGPKRKQPVAQDRESFVALPTSPRRIHTCACLLSCLPESSTMTDDRGNLTNWTPPLEAIQWGYPRLLLSSSSANAITRIRRREGPLLTPPAKSLICWRPVTLCKCKFRMKREIPLAVADTNPQSVPLAGECGQN